MRKQSSTKFSGGIFIIAGLISLAFTGYFVISNNNMAKNAIAVTGTISSIVTNYNDDDPSHTVYVTYNDDGKTVTGVLDTYTGSMKEGQEIECYYYPSNPNSLTTKRGGFGSAIITGALGIIFIACGIGAAAKSSKSRE